jgi:hypothetical protein
MKGTDCVIIAPAWTHSYKSLSTFAAHPPSSCERWFRANRSHTTVGADGLAPVAKHGAWQTRPPLNFSVRPPRCALRAGDYNDNRRDNPKM